MGFPDKDEGYGITGDSDRGVLLLYGVTRSPDLTGRKSVLATDYASDSTHRRRTQELKDILTDTRFEGGMDEARQLLSPPTADILHPWSGQEVLEELEENTDRDRYVVRFWSTPGETKDELLEYMADSDFYFMVNPLRAREVAGSKKETHKFLKDRDVPTIPSIDADEALDRGENYSVNRIGEVGEGYVLKASNSTRGMRQWHAEDWEQLIDIYESENIENITHDYIVQPFIPHDKDHRWMMYGGEPETGMIRWAPEEDYRTNSSRGENSVETRAAKAIQSGRIERLMPDGQEELELAEDAAGALADEFADPRLEKPNIVTSVDLLVTDPEDLEGLPESYVSEMERYSDDQAYMVAEFESLPGEMIDHMYMWEGPREGIPALQEAVFLEELAGNDPGTPEEIVDDIEDRIWARVRANYRSHENRFAAKYVKAMQRARTRPNTVRRMP